MQPTKPIPWRRRSARPTLTIINQSSTPLAAEMARAIILRELRDADSPIGRTPAAKLK